MGIRESESFMGRAVYKSAFTVEPDFSGIEIVQFVRDAA
jgi:hypothetical protein